jgi:U3 small nucleolar RNA-associated protein 18
MQGRCVARFKHEDGTCTSALAAIPASSSSSEYVAVGAESGAVSLFPGPQGASAAAAATAAKSFLHLTTPVTTLAFHPSAEILAMGSSHKADSLRLLHVPSGTVFGSWPTANTPLRKVQAISFSPNGALMATANDRGKVLLHRLMHYN